MVGGRIILVGEGAESALAIIREHLHYYYAERGTASPDIDTLPTVTLSGYNGPTHVMLDRVKADYYDALRIASSNYYDDYGDDGRLVQIRRQYWRFANGLVPPKALRAKPARLPRPVGLMRHGRSGKGCHANQQVRQQHRRSAPRPRVRLRFA